MHLLSWNIHGFSTFRKSADIESYLIKHDIVTLTETWTNSDEDIKDFLDDYEHFSVHGKRRHKHGRIPGGIVTFIQKDIANSVELLLKCEYGLFFKLDKYKFGLKQHVIICCIYVPCDGSTFYVDRPERDGIAELESYLVNTASDHAGCDIFVMGDFNSRTSADEDYILDDDVTYMPGADEWYVADNFCHPRRSRDSNTPTNAFGRSLLDMCRIFGIHILNGRFPGDHDGEYTFMASTGKSVVDYMLASSSLFEHVINFQIDTMTESDHFPLICELSCDIIQYADVGLRSAVRSYSRFKWNETKRDGFLELLADDTSTNKLDQSIAALDQNDINLSVGLLVEVIQRAAQQMKYTPGSIKVQPGISRRRCTDWWDDECDQLRRNKSRLLHIFRRTRSHVIWL